MKGKSGKLFGAFIGYSFGGPIGALIGAAIGQAVDSTGSEKYPGYTKNSEKEIVFVHSLILLLVGTARSGGTVTPQKLEPIRSFFRQQLGYTDHRYALVEQLIAGSLGASVHLPSVCGAIAGRTSYEERLYLVQLSYKVAASDGIVDPLEEDYIRRAAWYLGVSEKDAAAIGSGFSSFREKHAGAVSGEGEDPYAVMGLSPGCTDEEVQKSYRTLANKYHPDKVQHLGEEFTRLATKKFARINSAYERIKKERGLSTADRAG